MTCKHCPRHELALNDVNTIATLPHIAGTSKRLHLSFTSTRANGLEREMEYRPEADSNEGSDAVLEQLLRRGHSMLSRKRGDATVDVNDDPFAAMLGSAQPGVDLLHIRLCKVSMSCNGAVQTMMYPNL